MALSSIPGYIQGFIFSDASTDYFDAGVFKDQAGYGARNALTITVGTPAFVTVNGQKGMTLDNTCHGRFIPATPWEGTCIAVMHPGGMSVNGTIYPVLFGQAASAATNGSLRIVRGTAASYIHRLGTPGAVAVASCSYVDNGLKVSAWAMSQETRIAYSTLDGVTVTAGAPVADGGNGNAFQLCGASAAGDVVGQTARLGNLSGVVDDAVASTNTMTMFELHFFKGNPLITDAVTVAAEMAALKTKYGV